MWHPQDETEAASDITALIEWLRATGRWPEARPEGLTAWLATHTEGEDAELDRYRGLAVRPPAADGP
jgi:hypothetical protein